MKKYLFLIMILLITASGCRFPSNLSSDDITISRNTHSEYEQTFKDLGLGALYDFNFKLPHANKSWVKVWVEGYRNGHKEPQPLTELSYGLSPKDVEKGHLGLGILNPNNSNASIFLFAPGITQTPQKLPNNLLMTGYSLSIESDAMGDHNLNLPLGVAKPIAVYRRSQNQLKAVDLQNPDAVKQMIQQDQIVLLLMIKVDKKSH